jgi:nicotinate-nucleotide adenylyltransferase
VAEEALRRAGLDEVLFVPAARPPHKLDKILSAGGARVALLEAALSGSPQFKIEALELDREGPSYTIDTVKALLERLGGDDAVELFLILGGDNLPGLGAWREAEALVELVTPLVVDRGLDLNEALEGIEGSLPAHLLEKLRVGLLSLEPHPASSTAIRAMLRRGEDPGEHLPAACLEVVKERGLYGYSS